jgi:hypothetical protein
MSNSVNWDGWGEMISSVEADGIVSTEITWQSFRDWLGLTSFSSYLGSLGQHSLDDGSRSPHPCGAPLGRSQRYAPLVNLTGATLGNATACRNPTILHNSTGVCAPVAIRNSTTLCSRPYVANARRRWNASALSRIIGRPRAQAPIALPRFEVSSVPRRGVLASRVFQLTDIQPVSPFVFGRISNTSFVWSVSSLACSWLDSITDVHHIVSSHRVRVGTFGFQSLMSVRRSWWRWESENYRDQQVGMTILLMKKME